jgi:hypothetical protein
MRNDSRESEDMLRLALAIPMWIDDNEILQFLEVNPGAIAKYDLFAR